VRSLEVSAGSERFPKYPRACGVISHYPECARSCEARAVIGHATPREPQCVL